MNFSQSREATGQLIEVVVACAQVTENSTLREKVLSQTTQIVSDFSSILSNLHDRVVQGIFKQKIHKEKAWVKK